MKYTKLLLVVIFGFICNNTFSQGINENQLDSLGLKQGKWIEYKVLPHKVIENGKKIPVPGRANVFLLVDSLIFSQDSPIYRLEGEYYNGLKNGIWKEFYYDGKIRKEVNYLNNIPSGPIRVYYPNGVMAWKGFFSNETFMNVEYFHENGTFMVKEKVAVIEIAKWLYSLEY
jgi:hypothetical protein